MKKLRLDLKIGIIVIAILIVVYIFPVIPMNKNVIDSCQCIKDQCECPPQKGLVFVRGLDLISLEDLLEFLTKR
jgi:hypothetical protein